MAEDPKEIMSQEDIDAYIASVRAGEENQERGKLAQNSGDPALKDNASDDPTEIMTQEEIDAYIASVRTKEEKEKQGKETLKQQAPIEKSEDKPSVSDGRGAVSQDDIDTIITQQQEQETRSPQTNHNESGAMSQNDIDELIARQDKETQATSTEQDVSAAVFQNDMDTMITQIQEHEHKDREGEILQQELDNIFAQKQSEAPPDEKQDVWEELNHDILSQDEIDALLSGFQGEEPSPSSSIDEAIAQQKNEPPDSVGDITVISRQQHIKRQREKEENIIRKKQRASALIRELLRMEEKRIQRILANKDKMVNDDLYARYEITRADRTKLIVSMSDKTAKNYRSMHPGCCIYRI